jgi:hypothetical protein
MPHDARMTMKSKMLRVLIAAVAGLAAATAVVSGGGQPGSATLCQRSIAIDPQVTVSERSGSLSFVVRSNSCAAAASVAFEAVGGTAERQVDFMLENGTLTWPEGDVSSRKITATINDDLIREPLLEDFRVYLVQPTQSVRVVNGRGQGRIFDDDMQGRFTATDDRICLISSYQSCLPVPPGGQTQGPTTIQTMEPGHLIIAPIVLNVANSSDQMIHFETISGGLVEGIDFVSADQDVKIPAGQTVVLVQIELLPPAYGQPGESLFTQLSNYTAGAIADPNGVVTVLA